MVFPLRPGKFYGSSLPRPRIYVKPDGDRVDPPLSVVDPFMSWAEEAHWSMGGLSRKRLRLQGKIEGNVQKLRNQRENNSKSQAQAQAQAQSPISDLPRSKRTASLSPPPAPVATKRRRLMPPIEEEVKIDTLVLRGRRLVKKLGDDFDRVASSENEVSTAVVSDSSPSVRTRRRRLVKIGDVAKKVVEEGEKSKSEAEKSPVSGIRVRTSPRLSKN